MNKEIIVDGKLIGYESDQYTPDRVSRGFWRHKDGAEYFVIGVGILDEDGHGNPDAPRQVIYESSRSVKSGLINLRSEKSFTERVTWPDGIVRPRFVRVEYP